MEITHEELQRHYASLPDEELLAIDPAELTKAARACYDHEVEKRGLVEDGVDEESAEELDEFDTPDVEPDWMENAACACSYWATPGTHHAADAAHAKDVLEEAGIPCHLSVVPPDPHDEESGRFDQYRVMVPSPLLLMATSVLDREVFNVEQEAEWRAHLAMLSDDELGALTPDAICGGMRDRIARLTRAYQEEVAKRAEK